MGFRASAIPVLFTAGGYAPSMMPTRGAAHFWFGSGQPDIQGGFGTAIGVNQLLLAPVLIGRACQLDRVGVNVTGAGTAGKVLRLGLWRADTFGYPTSLLVEWGTIPADAIAFQTLAITTLLGTGLYWVGLVNQGAGITQPTVAALSTSAGATQTHHVQWVAVDTVDIYRPDGTILQAAQATPVFTTGQEGLLTGPVAGALPDPFPAITAAGTGCLNGAPLIFLRAAA